LLAVVISLCAAIPFFSSFFFNDTATTEIYTLSLHDALPIWSRQLINRELSWIDFDRRVLELTADSTLPLLERVRFCAIASSNLRSEEHTSELQSRRDLVCRLLLEKKKKNKKEEDNIHNRHTY